MQQWEYIYMDKEMSKRIMVTLPDGVYKLLEDWAKEEGRPVASLAAFIIESSARDKVDKTISIPHGK